MTMREIKWKDGMLPRGRHARLILTTTGEGGLIRFRGKSIPGICASRITSADQNGKWSSTTYTLRLAEGVIGVRMEQNFETDQYLSGVGSWAEAYETFRQQFRFATEDPQERKELEASPGPGTEAFKEFMRLEFPKTSMRIDRIETESEGLAQPGAALRQAFAEALARQSSSD